MSREVGHTPRGHRVTLERESRVEGPGPHVFVYDKEGRRYRVGVPTGTTAEQVEQVRSSVKDVKVELIDDRVRAYVVFDFHGKDMTLQLEGKLSASNGYLSFEPISGQIGSFPIPQSTLETAIQKMMDSSENREKLKLPAEMSGLKIENGEVVATYQ